MANAFIGKDAAPSTAELAAELGSAQVLWNRLCTEIGLPGEWHSYSKKAGWSMRLKSGKRNVLYLIPARGAFEVALVLGDRAVAAARDAGLRTFVDGRRRYAEGTEIRLAVETIEDVAAIQKLVRIKLDH